jgi:O-antigen/teichoic acid export membrane protein
MSKVTRNIIYNGLGQALGVLLSLVAVRFVFRRLGGDALGLIYFSVAFSAALSVAVQLGICESAVREVASHHQDRPEYIEDLIRTSSLLYWTAFLLLSLAAYLAAPYLVYHWVKLESLDAPTAIKILRILTIGALAALPCGLYRALLTGLQHMGLTNVIDVAGRALQQAGIFAILLLHGNLFHVAYWIALTTLAPVLVFALACAHFFSFRALLVPGFSRPVVRENIGYASGLMAITLCSWVSGQADKVIISKLLPLALLGIYTFARGAINQGMLATTAINTAVFPHFSALHGAGDTAGLRRAYRKVHDLISFGTVPVFAGVPFAAIPLFSRVFDMHAARLLLLPATILSLGYYMNGVLTAPYVVSLAVGRPDITARQNVAALFVVVPVSAFAIYYLGLNGAGLSWVIYHIFAYSYGLPRICRECLGVAPHVWYGHFLRILGVGVLIYGAAWLPIAWTGKFTLLPLAASYLVASAVYGIAAWGMMDASLRAAILAFVQRPRAPVPQAAAVR